MVFQQREQVAFLLDPGYGSFSKTPPFKWTPTGSLSRSGAFPNFRGQVESQSLESLKTLHFPKCLSSQHVFVLPIKNLLISQLAGQEKRIRWFLKIMLLPGEANCCFSLLLARAACIPSSLLLVSSRMHSSSEAYLPSKDWTTPFPAHSFIFFQVKRSKMKQEGRYGGEVK